MRTSVFSIVVVIALTFAAFAQTTEVSQDVLLERGVAAYRAGDYAAAITDLQAASHIPAADMQTYVNTGKLPSLTTVEKALVYLALAESKLGREADARGTVLRLVTAEKISPTYATLVIAEGAEFDTLAAQLVPESGLPRNSGQAAETSPAAPRVQVQQTIAGERAERQRIIDEMVARELEQIQREADARIAQLQADAANKLADVQRESEEKLAAARNESQEALAAVQRELEQKLAAARADAEARIAQVQREADQRIEAERASAAAVVAEAEANQRRGFLTSLRQADTLANNGDVSGATQHYARIASSEGAPREYIIAAAIGLYRTGAFREAADAFRRLGAFAKGEEDLRYYNAVALYETGSYDAAKKELSCALPFIEVNEDVARYRAKIEQTPSQTAMR